MANSDLALAAEFPPATREMWLALVERVLKGAPFEKRLVSKTYDGIPIEPLYPKAEPASQPMRGARGPWRIAQRLDHPDAAVANDLALADLTGGADALSLVFARAPSARGFGLEARTVDDLDRALRDVTLDLIQVRVEAGGWGQQAAALLVAVAERRGHPPGALDLDLGLDPIGVLAATGRISASWDVIAARCADTLGGLAERGFEGAAIRADGRPYHEAGASEAQELAAVLATGVAYLRALESGGHDLGRARDTLSFLLVADADEFLTVAKFRAFRRLWARVEELCGLPPKPARLHAETAWRMTTRRDPWVNLLRSTLAAFSAGIGGADGITVLPFTAALGLPDAFARRLARNAQLILLEEANLWRVADPAAGAGGFEALTEASQERAWTLFQEIECDGGVVESLHGGFLQERIADVRAGRQRNVSRRVDPITGTSEFPNLQEEPVAVLMPRAAAEPSEADDPSAVDKGPAVATVRTGQADGTEAAGQPFASLLLTAASGASLADPPPGAPGPGAIVAAPLPCRRDAEGFEQLRDLSDAHLARTGARPKVFLANLGPIAAFTPRATFTKAFFEAGGIEAPTNDGFPSLDALVAAFRTSEAPIACLCSSDELYATDAVPAAAALAAAGAAQIYLAGRPIEGQEHLGGIQVGFINARCNALAILEAAQGAAVRINRSGDES